MTWTEDPVQVLPAAECWQYLRDAPYGRIATAVGGVIDIVPVNFVVADGAVVFRTSPGTKLVEMVISPQVAVEVDGFDQDFAWSVVAKGTALRLEKGADIDAADRLLLSSWIPTVKNTYVRVAVERLEGRRFRRGVEPEQ